MIEIFFLLVNAQRENKGFGFCTIMICIINYVLNFAPRIATDKSSFLQDELGMKNPRHRRKIYLRASDIILFGSPESKLQVLC